MIHVHRAARHQAALRLSRPAVPGRVANATMSDRMMGILKPNIGVRGIAARNAFKIIVTSCLARIIGQEVETACAHYQYAMSTRVGTECVGIYFDQQRI